MINFIITFFIMSAVILSDHIDCFQDLLQKIQKREENERILWEKEMDMCKIKLYAHHPTQNQVVESKLCCLSNVTLQEAAELAHKVPLSDVFLLFSISIVALVRS